MHAIATRASTLGAALFLAAALACAGNDDPSTRTGAELYVMQGCNNCHGPDGTGLKGFAPTLHGKQTHWTRERLIAYLKEPDRFRREDPRLKAQGAPYTLAMPTYKMEPAIVLEKLADHVLAMP